MAKWLVTGGAGFIGTNLVLELIARTETVLVIDDLSRDGSINNSKLLDEKPNCVLYKESIVDAAAVNRIFEQNQDIEYIVHLAGQVSLMQSILNPLADFYSNAAGTMNILEAMRAYVPHSRMIFSSTNKVYGDLHQINVNESQSRYVATDFPMGMPIDLPLDFHGGYGCSKGAADQYVTDYHRIFGLDTIVFRQSAICGRFQHPKADQGWASFLVKETLANREIVLNGRGLQVRDLLDVQDLVDLITTTMSSQNIATRVYNVGGGPDRALSLLNLFEKLETLGYNPKYVFGDERPSDQKVFVADLRPISHDFNWSPEFSLDQIIGRLVDEEMKR